MLARVGLLLSVPPLERFDLSVQRLLGHGDDLLEGGLEGSEGIGRRLIIEAGMFDFLAPNKIGAIP